MTSFGIRTLKKFLSCPYAGHAASGGIVTTLATRTIKTKVLIIPFSRFNVGHTQFPKEIATGRLKLPEINFID